MPALRPARFLILRGGALGDFIVTLPVLNALRARWPDSYLELVGYPQYAELARAAGLADHVTSLHGACIARLYALDAQLPEDLAAWIRSFDFIVSFLHDPEGVVRDNLERAGARTVLYTSPTTAAGHVVDHLLKPLESLAIYAAGAAPRLILPPGGPEQPTPYAVLHPGSGSPRKNAPLEVFLRLARAAEQERGWTVFFLTGEADEAVAGPLAGRVPPGQHLANRPLAEVARLLAGASGYAGNDSGITHLAAALGTPTLALFGPSDPGQWAPRGPHVRIVHAPDGEWARLPADLSLTHLP